jgi:hypothetical protein
MERISDIRQRLKLVQPRAEVRPRPAAHSEVVGRAPTAREPEPPCECGDCVRANHGKPAVKYPATRYRPAYELHGVEARDFYLAKAKALAELDALKVKLRAEGLTAQRGDE